MIIMLILIILSVTFIVMIHTGLFRDSCFLFITAILIIYTVASGIACTSIHNSKIGIENTKFELNCEYEFLSTHKDSAIYFKRITDYNAKVIKNKELLHSVWTNWFISPAYENAKLIGEEK